MRYFLPALLILITQSAICQFSGPFFLSNHNNKTITQIGCADFTNDGKEDLLSTQHFFPNHLLTLQVQTDNVEFDERPAIQDSLGDIMSFAIGDINNDARNDIVLTHDYPASILWYENMNGAFTKHIVDTALDFTQKVLVAHLDQNDKLDIISLQHLEIVIYLANDEGFDTAKVIHGGTEFYDIDVADYNQDGFMDVSVASFGFEILLNDGNGNFTLLPKTNNDFTFGLRSGDVDMDGDNDIVNYVSLHGLYFYKNDGSGVFTFGSVALSSSDNFNQYGIIDLDCDDVNDIYTTLPQFGQAVWLKNLGNGQFSKPVILHTQAGEIVSSSFACDVNKDEKPDIIWGNLHYGLHLNECMFTGTDSETDIKEIQVFPNPTPDELTCYNHSPEKIELILVDDAGRKIFQQEIQANSHHVFLLRENGIYFMQIWQNGMLSEVKKIVKAE